MALIDEAIVSASPGETRIALLAEYQVVEFVIDRGAPAPGDVIEGRVIEVAAALNAAFVDIGDAAPGYLAKRGGAGVGATVMVEVTVAARPGKGAELKLAATGAQPSRRSPLARVLAAYPAIAQVAVDEMAALGDARAVFPAAAHKTRSWSESGAADALDEALARRVSLSGGASLDFAETAAATVIDIDGAGLAPAIANAAALPAIARHLRLRGIAGHILIDVIPTRDRRKLMAMVETLRALVADDPAPVQVAGHTPLGMIELTRRRSGPSLSETMLEPVSVIPTPLTIALDGVRAVLREVSARPGAALALALPPRAAAELRARPAVIVEVGRRLGRPLTMIERRDLDQFAIEDVTR
jgi:hypothetical protein